MLHGGGQGREGHHRGRPFERPVVPEGRDAEPSHYTCGRKYTSIMNQIANNYNSLNGNRMFGTGTNFGDPVCSFTQSKLRAVINDLEPKVVNRDFWIEIAKCESPGNGPNGWSSSFNAWGHGL